MEMGPPSNTNSNFSYSKRSVDGATCEVWHLEMVGGDVMRLLPTASRGSTWSGGGRWKPLTFYSPPL